MTAHKRKKVVIAGFGDTGLLAGILLSKDFEVLGISPKPCLVSGQELGMRLTALQQWKKHYLSPYQRYPKLDQVKVVQGLVKKLETEPQQVVIALQDGTEITESFDILIIASGVSNGFWRTAEFEDLTQIHQKLATHTQTIATAQRIAIIGGGATGVSCAKNIASHYPNKQVDLYFSQSQPLPGYHDKTRATIHAQLLAAGVGLHPGYRAQIPSNFNCDQITSGAIDWQSGQPASQADAIIWAVGQVKPNTEFLPSDMLDSQGFVKTNEFLQVPGGHPIFTLGDVAATDKNRSSARNWGFNLLAENIKAYAAGKPEKMKAFKPAPYRWGSIFGVQKNGLTVFQPNGGRFRFPAITIESILFPLFVHRMIYKGVRKLD